MTTAAKIKKQDQAWKQELERIMESLAQAHDVTTKEGMEKAKEDRRALREFRSAVEDTRKELKAPLLELEKALDGSAKHVTQVAKERETPIATLIQKEEQRIERLKQEEARKEQERLQAINDAMMDVMTLPSRMANASAAEISTKINIISILDGDAEKMRQTFQERLEEAKGAVTSCLTALRAMKEAAMAREAQKKQETPAEPPKETTGQGDIFSGEGGKATPEDARTFYSSAAAGTGGGVNITANQQRETMNALRSTVGLGGIQSEQVLGAIMRGDIPHVVWTGQTEEGVMLEAGE